MTASIMDSDTTGLSKEAAKTSPSELDEILGIDDEASAVSSDELDEMLKVTNGLNNSLPEK